MKSKSLISKQTNKKKSPLLVETILLAKKFPGWMKIAEILSCSRKNIFAVNLEKINEQVKEGEEILIPGKILSQGSLNKKIKIIALNFSETAKEKILNAKSELKYIKDEIKKNPEAKGIKILYYGKK